MENEGEKREDEKLPRLCFLDASSKDFYGVVEIHHGGRGSLKDSLDAASTQ